MTSIGDLGFSQIYLSAKKIEGVLSWFSLTLENFQPVPVRDFWGNGKLVLTDGHTRTYVAWLNGLTQIPTIYDNDEIVTCSLGHESYLNCILWCERLGIKHVSDFSARILSEGKYAELWEKRCDLLNNLVAALQTGKIDRDEFNRKQIALEKQRLFIYGLSTDLSILFCENPQGQLFEQRYDTV